MHARRWIWRRVEAVGETGRRARSRLGTGRDNQLQIAERFFSGNATNVSLKVTVSSYAVTNASSRVLVLVVCKSRSAMVSAGSDGQSRRAYVNCANPRQKGSERRGAGSRVLVVGPMLPTKHSFKGRRRGRVQPEVEVKVVGNQRFCSEKYA